MSSIYNPKVSIIIPVYNGANFLNSAIQSALNQTYKNKEIIVVNDGSKDDGETEKIALQYGEQIKYYSKSNGGVSSALNLALEKMTGEYFSWLSHDDLYYDDKLEKQIKYIEENNLQDEKVVLFGDYSIINEDGKFVTECKKDHKEIEEKPEYSLLRGHLNGITLLIPKKAFDEYGKFDESLRCTQDYEMWNRMMKTYKFIHQNQTLSMTRVHSNQDTAVNPRVTTEGNKLWINLIEEVSTERKIELEGNELNYYKRMKEFLQETPYGKAKEHCEIKIKDIMRKVEEEVLKIKVSIIIPFYNRKELVIKAINSVLEQTHKNTEIILINDSSTEDVKIVEEYIDKIEKIKYIKLLENKGASFCRNIGIKEATGEYIAFLDSDDLFVKEKIKTQLTEMIINKSVFSHTSYIRKDNNLDMIVDTSDQCGIIFPDFIKNCKIATPTVMIEREYLNKKNAFYNEKIGLGEDICFYMDLLEDIKVTAIKQPLSIVNTNDMSSAYDISKQVIGIKNIIKHLIEIDYNNKYNNTLKELCKEFYNLYLMEESVEGESEISIINALENEIKNYMLENKKVSEKLQELNCKCNEMENSINNIMMSASWKITAPLRKITYYLRKIARKIKNILKR